MKHLELLVIIAVVCLNLTAQNRVIDSHNKKLTQDKLNIAQNPTFKLPGDLVYFSPIDAWAVSEMITQLWDNNVWMNMAKTNNSYNADGLLTNDMNYSWSGSDWVDNARETYSYDANNLLVSSLSENWEDGAWVQKYRSSYTYNGQGKIYTWLSESYVAGAWGNISLYTYTYTGNNIKELLTQNWQSGAWVNLLKTTNEFNGQGLITTSITQMWLVAVWMNISKSINTYNADNLIDLELEQSWVANAWVDKNKSTYTYGSNNKPQSVLTEQFVNSDWVNHSQVFYTYDGNENNTELLEQDWVNSAWENFFKITMTYVMITDVENTELPVTEYKLMNNYPNPFNPLTTINYSIAKEGRTKLTVYNIVGSKVAVLADENKPIGNYSVQFNAGTLPSGVYFYSIQTNSIDGKQNFTNTKKMLLLK